MEQKVIILDGGMGTALQQSGLKPGENPAVYGMTHPEQIRDIHAEYIANGSTCVYTNTFGASAFKLEGSGYTVDEVIPRNVRSAREAVEKMRAQGKEARVALDVGPLGELLELLGTLSFEAAYDAFREIVEAGERAGADLVVFETFTDLYELKAAVLAAKEHTNLPIWATMSFEANGRTFLGTSAAAMALTLEGLGVSALGINCSLGPKEILPIAESLMEWTDLPLIIKPNAGLPDPRTGEYGMTAAEFAEQMVPFLEMGVGIVGGCCGTDAIFTRELTAKSEHFRPRRKAKTRRGVCAAGEVAEFGKLNIIGERINPTGKKKLQQALRDEDMDYVKKLAVEQVESGAHILDVNVGAPGVDEVALMPKVVKAVQSVVSVPLQLDSADPKVIEAGLRVVNGRPIVNSVNGERERMDTIFPLVAHYGTAVLGLAMDETGIPENAAGRLAIADRILAEADSYGIPREDVIVDCLTLTVSAQQEQAKETLQAVRQIHDQYGLHCALGVSNISFGLPMRQYITTNFLIQAMSAGLDFPIVNINEKPIRDAVAAYRVLSGEDADSAAYIRNYAGEEAARKAALKAKKEGVGGGVASDAGGASAGGGARSSGLAGNSGNAGTSVGSMSSVSGGNACASGSNGDSSGTRDPLQQAVLQGLEQDVREISKELLQTEDAMDIISKRIIPALDEVGNLYEKGEFFLPQLLNSATAACAGLDLIKAQIAKMADSPISKGKIILATVEGDIHDIGKNIVKVVLENYGYEVIDLGRDVPVDTVVKAAIEHDVYLVGLSALMTTTVPAMEATIKALRASGHDCKIMVGGAVMTPEYSMEIGADYYSKDAQAAVAIAKEVLG
jgi:5-methyltetrahydrofolate--homocysteine methyltransferase